LEQLLGNKHVELERADRGIQGPDEKLPIEHAVEVARQLGEFEIGHQKREGQDIVESGTVIGDHLDVDNTSSFGHFLNLKKDHMPLFKNSLSPVV